jgi:hypothetical protein
MVCVLFFKVDKQMDLNVGQILLIFDCAVALVILSLQPLASQLLIQCLPLTLILVGYKVEYLKPHFINRV